MDVRYPIVDGTLLDSLDASVASAAAVAASDRTQAGAGFLDERSSSQQSRERQLPPWNGREVRHEVGNALTPALAYSQYLLNQMPAWADANERAALQAIRDGVSRAVRLLSMHEARDPALEVCDLCDAVAEAAGQVAPERAPDVHVELPGAHATRDNRQRAIASFFTSASSAGTDQDCLKGLWPKDQVVQILVNLLSNAAKYSAPGTPIRVKAYRRGSFARVEVRDRGIGVPAGALEDIFRGARTTAARRMAAGSGIGLPLSRSLAECLGGRLWAERARPGMTFILELPLGDVP